MDKNLVNRDRCIKLKDRTVYHHSDVNLDKNVNNCCVSLFAHHIKTDKQQTANLNLLNILLKE